MNGSSLSSVASDFMTRLYSGQMDISYQVDQVSGLSNYASSFTTCVILLANCLQLFQEPGNALKSNSGFGCCAF